jgi:hypothetical protein
VLFASTPALTPLCRNSATYRLLLCRWQAKALIAASKLNKEINAALADAKMKARRAELGVTALPGSPADFNKLIADETEKWGKVIRTANIKAE